VGAGERAAWALEKFFRFCGFALTGGLKGSEYTFYKTYKEKPTAMPEPPREQQQRPISDPDQAHLPARAIPPLAVQSPFAVPALPETAGDRGAGESSPTGQGTPAGAAELPGAAASRAARPGLPAMAGGRTGRLPGPMRPRPPKLYRIGEVVAYAALSRQTVHNYTTMGLLHEAAWTEGGHRLYDESVFERLDAITAMKAQGRSLEDIREHFEQVAGV